MLKGERRLVLHGHDNSANEHEHGNDKPKDNERGVVFTTALQVAVLAAVTALLHETVIVLLEQSGFYLAHDVKQHTNKNEQ